MTEHTHPSDDLRPPDGAIVVGERRHFYFNEAGQPAYQVVELTAADFLNPLPDDQFDHGALHDSCARRLGAMLHHHFRYSPTASVHIRPKLVWNDALLDQPMPDVVVVNHLVDQHRHRPVLDLAAEQQASGDAEQVSVRAIFEVTSPKLAELDLVAKTALYARAGVPEYWFIDTGLRPDQPSPRFAITGWRLDGEHYAALEPQADGRFTSKACRLWLAVSDDRQGFQLGDLRTGNPLPVPADDDDPSISAQAEAGRRAQSIASQLKL